jgi:hypothetical protein
MGALKPHLSSGGRMLPRLRLRKPATHPGLRAPSPRDDTAWPLAGGASRQLRGLGWGNTQEAAGHKVGRRAANGRRRPAAGSRLNTG